MKYEVDSWNNFCRVFEVPETYPEGYCFGGGKDVTFKMVDWFYPVEDVGQAGVSKEVWKEKVGPIETTEVELDDLIAKINPFLKEKMYLKPDRQYLVICDFGATWLMDNRETR